MEDGTGLSSVNSSTADSYSVRSRCKSEGSHHLVYQKGMDVKYTIKYAIGWPGLNNMKIIKKEFADEDEAWAFYNKLQYDWEPGIIISEVAIFKNEKLDGFVNK